MNVWFVFEEGREKIPSITSCVNGKHAQQLDLLKRNKSEKHKRQMLLGSKKKSQTAIYGNAEPHFK